MALDLVGFEPGVENSKSVLWVLRAATALVPVLFVLASAWAARNYPLGRLRHQEILDELGRRRSGVAVPTPAD